MSSSLTYRYDVLRVFSDFTNADVQQKRKNKDETDEEVLTAAADHIGT